MRRLRGAVVGAGYFSQFHLDAWNRLEHVDVVAVCDVDLAKARKAAAAFKISRAYDDVSQMIRTESPDFVDLITRPDTHGELIDKAVEASVPIICQKPFAPSYDLARQWIEKAAVAGVPLMVHENFRFQPWYREIKRLLDARVIGDRLHSIAIQTRLGDGWQRDAYLGRQPYFRQMERFLVFETGVHFIDTLRFLGGDIQRVYALLRRWNRDIAGEDAGMLLFEFGNQGFAIWDANRYNESNADDPRYTFGRVLIDADGGSIRLYEDGRLTVQRLGEKEQPHDYGPSRYGFAGDCVLATQKHFVDCLRTATPFETSGAEYLKTLQVQEAVYESAASRQPVDVRSTTCNDTNDHVTNNEVK